MLALIFARENPSEAEANTATSSRTAAMASVSPRMFGVSAA